MSVVGSFIGRGVIPVLVGLFGIFLIMGGVKALFISETSADWPRATGKVISSEAAIVDIRGRRGPPSYMPAVRYEFSVNGKRFEGRRVAVADMGSTDKQRIESIVRRYAQGASVTVYYDPADPSQCLLQPGAGDGALFQVVFGAAFVLAGVIFALVFPKAGQPASREFGAYTSTRTRRVKRK